MQEIPTNQTDLADDVEAAYSSVREYIPKILRVYDREILHGYDAGKMLSFNLNQTKKYTRVYEKLFTELRAVALRKVMPMLPLERANKSEMHLYALRDILNCLLRGSAALLLEKYNGETDTQKYFVSNLAVLCEISNVMTRLVDHAAERQAAD